MMSLSRKRTRSAVAPAFYAVAALFVAGCSFGTSGDEPVRPEDPVSFINLVREDIREDAWQSLLSSSDPVAYEARVVRAGIPEVEFIAELFGLLQEDAPIRSGPELEWEDLERIDSIVVAAVSDTIPPVIFSGTAFLESGETREVSTIVSLVQGRFVLSLPSD